MGCDESLFHYAMLNLVGTGAFKLLKLAHG